MVTYGNPDKEVALLFFEGVLSMDQVKQRVSYFEYDDDDTFCVDSSLKAIWN